MDTRYRYIANRPMKRGVDEQTGEPLWFARGDEIPASQFGSAGAIRALINTHQIAQVPVIDDSDADHPRTAFDRDLAARVEKLEAENADLKGKLAARDERPPTAKK